MKTCEDFLNIVIIHHIESTFNHESFWLVLLHQDTNCTLILN